MPNHETDKLALSVAEAVRATGISKTLLYEQIATGALKTRKLGKRRLVLKVDLDAFLRGLGDGEGDAAA